MKSSLKQKIDVFDRRITEFVDNHRCNLLSEFLDGITSLGSPVIILLIIGVLWSVGESLTAKHLLLGLLISGIVVRTIKRLTSRTRPEKHLNMVFSEKTFPSGHSTLAFMTATILNHFYSRPAAFFSLAVTVAFSRIYLEDHYPSDALAGCLIGLTISIIILL